MRRPLAADRRKTIVDSADRHTPNAVAVSEIGESTPFLVTRTYYSAAVRGVCLPVPVALFVRSFVRSFAMIFIRRQIGIIRVPSSVAW